MIGYSFIIPRASVRQNVANPQLIIGKWLYNSETLGHVVMLFKADKKGFRYTDSTKTIQKFKYQITPKALLKLYIDPHHPEIYHIDSLTPQTLEIKEYPYKKTGESISVFEGRYKRSPAKPDPPHIFIPIKSAG